MGQAQSMTHRPRTPTQLLLLLYAHGQVMEMGGGAGHPRAPDLPHAGSGSAIAAAHTGPVTAWGTYTSGERGALACASVLMFN